MSPAPFILFPHSSIQETEAKKILSFFSPLTVFQPWYMAPPSFLKACSEELTVLHPPPGLRPEENFPNIVSEYKAWTSYHQDRGFGDFLNAARNARIEEEHSWDIREAIRNNDRTDAGDQEDLPLKWHLLLHLACDIEEDRSEADRLLDDLRTKVHPLQGALGEDVKDTLLNDLPRFIRDRDLNPQQLEQTIEAWFGLFRNHLSDHNHLITFSPSVMEAVSEMMSLDDLGGHVLREKNYQFLLPDFSHLGWGDFERSRHEAAQVKSLLALKDAIVSFWEDPGKRCQILNNLMEDLKKEVPKIAPIREYRLTFQYIDPESRPAVSSDALRNLPGNTLLFIEDNAP